MSAERRVAPTLRELVSTSIPSTNELDELRAEIERLRATNPRGWGQATSQLWNAVTDLARSVDELRAELRGQGGDPRQLDLRVDVARKHADELRRLGYRI